MGGMVRWQTKLEFYNIVFTVLLVAFCLFQHMFPKMPPKMTLNPNSIISLRLTIPSSFLLCENY